MNSITILAAEGGNPMNTFLMMGAVILVMYFTMLRPQNKKRKAAQAYRDNIQKGDKIITVGGIHGKVDNIKDSTVIIIVEGGMKLEVEKSVISMDSSSLMTEETAKQAS